MLEENTPASGQPVSWPDSDWAASPEACSYHGLRWHGACHCFWDWDGGTCTERRNWVTTGCLGPRCANCSLGVCFDDPARRNASRRATARPAVYVYPLPPGFNQLRPRIASERNTPYTFWQRLEASPYVTGDPEQADFFFVPVSAMGIISHGVIPLALRYVAHTWPYFNASGGRDHLIVAPWDFGGSWVARFPGFEHVRYISHWGLTEKDARYANTCELCGPSYVPGKDFVIPDTLESRFAHAPPSGAKRTTLLYFAGGPTSEIRKQLLDVGQQVGPTREDVVIVTNTGRDLSHDMDAARFCLAPPGAGFGTRFSLAVTRGCIPVLVGDNIAPVFDGYLDWSAFSLRVREADIPRVVDIIDAVSLEEEQRLRESGAAVKHHFMWTADDREDAFETTMKYLLKFKDWDPATATAPASAPA